MAYKTGAPNTGAYGNDNVIFTDDGKPAIPLYGRGGVPTRGALSPLAGGGLVVFRQVVSGLPGSIVPSITPAPLLPR